MFENDTGKELFGRVKRYRKVFVEKKPRYEKENENGL